MKWFGKYRQDPIEAGDRVSRSELPAASAVGKAQAISSKRTVYKIKRLSQSVTKVVYGANQTETTTNQLLDGISTIGKQMDVQLKAVSQAVEIISEMGAASQEIAASVNEVAAGSSQTAVAVSRGKNAVQRSTDVMAEIQRIVEENAQAVRVLGEKTQQISKIVTTIKEIASQTNLLALNAAIEAARAGDAGRGFAVVADEVKKLAGNSSEAATQISRLIASIQADAKATVGALAQSVSSVTEGSRVVGETGQALDEIINAVDHSNRQVQDISEAVAEQAAHSDQLMQVADSIKSAVDKAAVFVETATFDAEQQQASLHTLLQVTRDLRTIQDGVEKEIGAAIEDQDQESKPYTFGLPADPVIFDPALSQDTNSNNVMREIFVGLLQLGQDGKPIPAIASSWHLEEDGRTYTLAIRDDVYFHHGRQVEAKDAKYTLERIVSPATKSPRAGLFLGIEGAKEFADGRASEIRGIRVLDRFKLVIRLTTPNLRFLSNLANLAAALVPRDVMEQRGTEFTKNPVGAGPFVFEQWLPGDRIELRANTRYFEGRPYADRLMVKIYAGADALLDGFFHGEVGHLRIDASGFDRLQSHPVYRSQFSKLEPVDVQYCGLNCVKPPFNNPLVRQAVNFAFDRQAYMQSVLKGHAVISRGALPPAMVGSTVKEYTYDLAKAKELMRQAGFGNGYPGDVVLHVRSNNVEQATRANAIAQALEQIGIHVQIKAIPWVDFLKGETMDQCHLYLIAATGGHAEGHDYLSTWFHTRGIGHSNFTRYSNPEVDRLLDDSETIVSPQKRHEYYQRANAIIHTDAPWLFLFHPQYYMAKQPEVKGLAFRNNGDVFLKNVWLEDLGEVVN